jgi:hypothetical protein
MQNFKSYLEESDEINKLLKAYKDNERREKYYLERVNAKFSSGTLTVEIVKTSKGYGDTDSSEETYEFSYTSDKGGGFVSSKKVFLDEDVLEFLGLKKLQPRYFGDRAVCFDKYADYGIADPVFKKMIIKVITYFD